MLPMKTSGLVGDFQIGALISDKGGMGDVYEAFQLSVKRKVAAKALKEAYRGNDAIRRRFEEEAVFLARLNHPNIVNVLAFDADNLVIFMEFLEGAPLDLALQNAEGGTTALALAEALAVMDQVLAALSHAHRHGLIHRDVKPGNIFVAPDGQVKLTDFGIAKIVGQDNLETTRLGLGSPSYMAPEQIMGEGMDGRTDIYAAGIVLYQLLTGQMPFSGKTYEEIIVRHIQNAVPSPSEIVADLPPLICDIVLTATAKKPEDRFQTAEAFRNALAQAKAAIFSAPAALAPPPEAGHAGLSKPVRASLAVLLLLGLGLGAAFFRGPATGSVQVLTNEPAEIWIAGERRGVTPSVLNDVPVGPLAIELTQPEFMTLKREVLVEKGKTVAVEAVFPAAGLLRVASTAPGRDVELGGVARGKTPLSLKLPVGRHQLRVGAVQREVTILEDGEHQESFE